VTTRRDCQSAGGVWQGLNPRTGTVASAIGVTNSAPPDATIFIQIDGASITRPERDPGEPQGERGQTMKRVLLIGTVASLGLMTAAAGQDSLGRDPLAPDNQPSGYTGAEPSLLGPGGPNWEPSPATPSNPFPYDSPYPAGTGGVRKLSA